MKKEINVLSTFNGMGCIWYALDRANINVNKRYSSEIDKYANQANDVAYSDTIQLGDITTIKAKNLERIDLFVGGSPCQGFSFAGKQLAFDDPRSKLFFEFVRLWNEIKAINPDAKFLLENVNMKKNELRIISEYLGVFPVNINSNLVSAQNRNRWYWTNIKTKDVGLFAENWVDIPQPEDKGILLKDILQPESEVDEKYYLSDTMIKWLNKHSEKRNTKINTIDIDTKASCLTATAQIKQNLTTDYIKVDKTGIVKSDQSKAICLTAGGNSGGNHSDMDLIIYGDVKFGRTEKAKKIRRENNKRGKDYNPFGMKEIVNIDYNKSGALLTSVNKDNLLSNGYKLRRYTPRECGRLQTFTDAELDVLLNAGISDTQLYKMFGNGWTVDVISHILSYYEPE